MSKPTSCVYVSVGLKRKRDFSILKHSKDRSLNASEQKNISHVNTLGTS